MANLIRFDPFFEPFAVEPFEDMFRGALRPLRRDFEHSVPSIRIDVEETEKSYLVKAEIPGVKKEDINVSIEGGAVSISAEVVREKDVKEGGKVIRSERYFGTVRRDFSLPQDIDEGASSANYVNGILELTLQKKAPGAARKLAVQ